MTLFFAIWWRSFSLSNTTSRGDLEKEDRIPFYLFIDEVQNFIQTSLPTVFSEARKFGLSLTVGNQQFNQLEGDTLEALLGNVGATIIFRMQNERDAKPIYQTRV